MIIKGLRNKVKNRKRLKYIKIPKPPLAKFIGFLILTALIVSGLTIIHDVNKEFAIRQIAGRFQEFRYATLSFNNIYSGLPGDITNGSFYWKDTKDGNGDKKVEINSDEEINAWKQLQEAKLIDLPYTLTNNWDNGMNVLVPGKNVPSGKDENSGFYFGYNEALGTQIFGLGGVSDRNGSLSGAALTPDEAYDLDLMIDDGVPDKGNLTVNRSENSTDCFAAGEYKKETQLKECILLFKL